MAESSVNDRSNHSVGSEPVDLAAPPQSLARAVIARRSEYVRPRKIRIKIGTWNVAACPGTDKDLASWFVGGRGIDQSLAALDLFHHPAVEHRRTEQDHVDDSDSVRLIGGEHIGLYVLGLQEVVDLNMTREYMSRAVYADTGPMDRWKAALEAAMPSGYELVMAEQMTGLLLLMYASPEIAPTISNVSTKQVGTGILGYFGNKGAVTTRLVLGETTRIVFVNCHLASGTGTGYLDRRCWDVGQVLSKTQFDPVVHSGVAEDDGDRIGDEDFAFWFGDLNFRLDGLPGDDIRRLLTLHARGEYDIGSDKPPPALEGGDGVMVTRGSESDDDTTTISSMHSREQSFDSLTSLPDPDDFPEDPSQDPASLQATLDSLLPHDQLRKLMAERKLFHDGWREGPISFLPTYKYDVGTVGLFDSSEKQRAPSWCDRILYRARKDKEEYDKKVQEEKEARRKDEEMRSRGLEEDDDVLFSYDPEADGEEQPKETSVGFDYDEYNDNDNDGDGDDKDVAESGRDGSHNHMSLDIYTSHQRIISSDHKPVISIFTLEYDAVDADLKAKVHAEVARELDRAENEGRPGITLIVEGGDGQADGAVDFGDVGFFEKHSCSLTIANTGGVAASFEFLDGAGAGTGEEEPAPATWLKTFFRPDDEDGKEHLGQPVTLEPGETVSATIEAQVSAVAHLRALNDAHCRLEDILVLRVEGGRDHFIPVRGTWLPSCFGRSIDELIRVPDGGVRKFVREKGVKGAITYDCKVHCSAPRELFKLTEAVQIMAERCVADAAMLEDMCLPPEPGWPLEASTWWAVDGEREAFMAALISCLDTDGSLTDALPVQVPSPRKLEALSAVLLLFLASLTDGLVPPQLWAKLCTALPNPASLPVTAWPDVKLQVLDILSSSPSHNIAFVFLTATLSRVASELTSAAPAPPVLGGLGRRLSFLPGEYYYYNNNNNNNHGHNDTKKKRARERRYAELVGPLALRAGDKDGRAAKERERIVMEMFLRREDEG